MLARHGFVRAASRPPGRLSRQTALSYTAPATAGTPAVVSHLRSNNKRLMAHGHVVEHQAHVAVRHRMAEAGFGDLAPVVVFLGAL